MGITNCTSRCQDSGKTTKDSSRCGRSSLSLADKLLALRMAEPEEWVYSKLFGSQKIQSTSQMSDTKLFTPLGFSFDLICFCALFFPLGIKKYVTWF